MYNFHLLFFVCVFIPSNLLDRWLVRRMKRASSSDCLTQHRNSENTLFELLWIFPFARTATTAVVAAAAAHQTQPLSMQFNRNEGDLRKSFCACSDILLMELKNTLS